MKTTVRFGKIAYNRGNKKYNEVTIDLELRETSEGIEFSARGYIWNHIHTDIRCGGQCLDTIAEFITDPLFKEIHRLWKLYHLNSMHAGTVEQEEAIEKWKAEGNKYDYTAVCDYLKSINLYEVEHEGKPYKYGHAWLYRAIPKTDLNKIMEIMGV